MTAGINLCNESPRIMSSSELCLQICACRHMLGCQSGISAASSCPEVASPPTRGSATSTSDHLQSQPASRDLSAAGLPNHKAPIIVRAKRALGHGVCNAMALGNMAVDK